MNHNELPVAYPLEMDRQAPPVGYPIKDSLAPRNSQAPIQTQSRGDGFWKGCCAAICCCCLLDACCF